MGDLLVDDEQAWLAIAAYQVHERDKCCHYGGRQVDGIRRRVTCQQCGEELDPFDCLLQVAVQHKRTAEHFKNLQRQAAEAKERLDTLLREESNARARVTRLKAKEPA